MQNLESRRISYLKQKTQRFRIQAVTKWWPSACSSFTCCKSASCVSSQTQVLIASFYFMSLHVQSSENTATLQLCNSISTDLCPLWHFNAPSICILVNSPIISNSRTCTSSHSSSFSRSIFHVPGPSRLFQWICFFLLSVSTFLEHSPVVLFDFMVSWSHLPSWRFLSIASLVKTKMQNQGFPPWFVALVPVV